MKMTSVKFMLSACLVSSVLLFSCQKDIPEQSSDTESFLLGKGGNGNGNNGNGLGNGGTSTNTVGGGTSSGTVGGGTSSGTVGGGTTTGTAGTNCFRSQGYWFGNSKRTWPVSSIMIAGTSYTQEQATAIWRSSNKGGKTDVKKAFSLLVTIQLAGTSAGTYTGTNWNDDVTTVSNWLRTYSPLNPMDLSSTKMTTPIRDAYNRLKEWVEAHHCEDVMCPTDIENWFGSRAQTWPSGSLTIGTSTITYSYAEGQALWQKYMSGQTNDALRALFLYASIRLSGVSLNYSGASTDLTTLTNWLQSLNKLSSTNSPSASMPSNVKDAYNRLREWIKDNDCDGDDD